MSDAARISRSDPVDPGAGIVELVDTDVDDVVDVGAATVVDGSDGVDVGGMVVATTVAGVEVVDVDEMAGAVGKVVAVVVESGRVHPVVVRTTVDNATATFTRARGTIPGFWQSHRRDPRLASPPAGHHGRMSSCRGRFASRAANSAPSSAITAGPRWSSD